MSEKQFDYAAAWRDLAWPSYQALPADVRGLLARVAEECGDLNQKPDLSMPWPNDPILGDRQDVSSNLRETFDKIPAEILAYSARVIYFLGHWHPHEKDCGDFAGRDKGSHWKFAHYADQSLRDRLIRALNAEGKNGADILRGGDGPFQIYEGAIRICYSSRNMWSWEEVAPATREGLERAKKLRAELSSKIGRLDGQKTRDHDTAAWEFMRDLKTRDLGWPGEWQRFIGVADRYMREKIEIDAARARQRTVKRSKGGSTSHDQDHDRN